MYSPAVSGDADSPVNSEATKVALSSFSECLQCPLCVEYTVYSLNEEGIYMHTRRMSL